MILHRNAYVLLAQLGTCYSLLYSASCLKWHRVIIFVVEGKQGDRNLVLRKHLKAQKYFLVLFTSS